MGYLIQRTIVISPQIGIDQLQIGRCSPSCIVCYLVRDYERLLCFSHGRCCVCHFLTVGDQLGLAQVQLKVEGQDGVSVAERGRWWWQLGTATLTKRVGPRSCASHGWWHRQCIDGSQGTSLVGHWGKRLCRTRKLKEGNIEQGSSATHFLETFRRIRLMMGVGN